HVCERDHRAGDAGGGYGHGVDGLRRAYRDRDGGVIDRAGRRGRAAVHGGVDHRGGVGVAERHRRARGGGARGRAGRRGSGRGGGSGGGGGAGVAVPARATLWVVAASVGVASSVTTRLALRAAADPGLKVTLTVQVPAGATGATGVPTHVFVWAKSAALVPL